MLGMWEVDMQAAADKHMQAVADTHIVLARVA